MKETVSEGRLSKEALAEIQDEARQLVVRMELWGVADTAANARRVRRALWKDQWSDELVHGEDAFPFEGASDVRFRLVEQVVRLLVAEKLTALAQAQPGFGAAGREDALARFVASTWGKILGRDLALEWYSQMALVALYLEGDGRGAAGLWIGWDEREELRPALLTMEEVAAAWQELGRDPEALQIVASDPEQLAAVLKDLGLVRTGAAAAARSLAEGKPARVPRRQVVRSQPSVRALGLGMELFADPATPTGRSDAAREMHVVSWLTMGEIRARAAAEGWDERFVRACEALEGTGTQAAVFPEWDYDSDELDRVTRVEAAREAGKFQLVQSFFTALTPEGVEGRFEVLWSPGIDVAATDARLVDTPWGGWPVLLFSNRVAGSGALDGVGVAEEGAGLQMQGKLAIDTISNVSMMQLPPIVQKGTRAAGAGEPRPSPLDVIHIGAAEDIQWMRPPQVPQTTVQFLSELRLLRDEQFGLPNEKIPGLVTEILQGWRIKWWLLQAAEAVRRVLAVALAHMSPDELAQYPELAAGGSVLPVRLTLDPRSWSIERLEKVARIFRDILMPMDRQGSLDLPAAVRGFVLELLPEHAELLPEAPQEAQAKELADEQKALELIRAGIRPEVPEGGAMDYAGRAQMYRDMEAANPSVFADMAPDKQQLLRERIEALDFQAQQQQNAQIGRTGVREQVGALPAAEGGEEA